MDQRIIGWKIGIKTFFVIGILFIGISAFTAGPAPISQPIPGKGKVFNFTATKLGIPILKATIKIIEELSLKKDKSLFKIQAIFQSRPSLELLFRMNNRFTSTLESGTYTPVTNVKEIDQGGLLIKKKNSFQTFTFDPLHQKVVVESKEKKEKQEIPLPPDTYDPLSMLARLYLKEDLIPGQDIPMSIFDGERLRQLVFHSNKEKIKSKRYGEVETIRLVLKTFFSTFRDQEGTIRIWFTTDGNKTPILIEEDLPVGKIRFELESIEGT
ncbi:MAG: DUF3108 domain-containing protein [Thermodesulfobacteriota bacterium]|jgi:hypothetical protein